MRGPAWSLSIANRGVRRRKVGSFYLKTGGLVSFEETVEIKCLRLRNDLLSGP